MIGFRRVATLLEKDDLILEQARKNKDTVYGSRAVKAQLGLLGREPKDWDILSKYPLKSAESTERILDKESGGDYYYVKKSKRHPGTVKLQEKGLDGIRGTSDDIQVADFTKGLPKEDFVKRIDGIKVLSFEKTLQDKERALADPRFHFRQEKDLDDAGRMNVFKKIVDKRF